MASIRKKSYRTASGQVVTTKKWYVRYRDADGILREVPGYTDRKATDQLAAKLERRVAHRKEGLSDPFAEHRERPLAQHLEDFETSLRAKAVSEEQIKLVLGRCRKIAKTCKFTFLPDLSASKVESYLAMLRREGLSAQTINHTIRNVRQFSRWLLKDRRIPDDPLISLELLNVDSDRRHVRRVLTESELHRLLSTTKTGKRIAGLTGHDRAILYLTATYTGLRASELASLTSQSFELTAAMPLVRVRAGYSKRRREDTLPLHSSLLPVLRPWLATKKVTTRVWPGNWAEAKKAGRLLQADLKTAGIPYRDDLGRVADFHALRHTFITRLGQAGVPIQKAKELARHSDVNLTLNVYTHLGLAEATEAVATLPPVSPDLNSVPLANGNDSTAKFPTPFPTTGDFSRPSAALVDTTMSLSDRSAPSEKTSKTCENNRGFANPEESLESLSDRRTGGRVAYCTGLENRQRREAFVSSNLTPSVLGARVKVRHLGLVLRPVTCHWYVGRCDRSLGLHGVYFGLVIHRDPHRTVPHWLMEDGAFNLLMSMQSFQRTVGEAFGF